MIIHVAARNEQYEAQFSKNNPNALDVVLHRGATSLFTLLQAIIDGEDDYALFVHDDVFLPSDINSTVSRLICSLNADWPNWGICGNAGISSPTLSDNSRVCRFLFDPHGGPSLSGYVIPAETIDGNTILINCRALRQANVRLPKFEGFQFYDISLSIETLAAGLAVLLAPQLACYHDSKGNQFAFDWAFGSKTLIDYLSSKLSNRSFTSLNGTLKLPFRGNKRGHFDICNTAVKNAAIDRSQAKIAFVIRTQFRDTSLLHRAISSTLAFAAATKNAAIKTYIVTEFGEHDAIQTIPNCVSIISSTDNPTSDTRNRLIKQAVNSINEDFVLFLDDDDWVFPNEADYISDLLTCLPATAHLVMDSQSFSEGMTVPGETDWRNSTVRPQRRFLAHEWPQNFTGNNYIPMCGAFYSRRILSQQPNETYENITYYEDYCASMFALLNPSSVFFSAPKLVAGISIRSLGSGVANTVNLADRTKWHQSLAELSSLLCANTSNNVAFTLGRELGFRQLSTRPDIATGHTIVNLSKTERVALGLTRVLIGSIYFIAKPKHYRENIKRWTSRWKLEGLRGLIRAVSDTRLMG